MNPDYLSEFLAILAMIDLGSVITMIVEDGVTLCKIWLLRDFL